MATDRVNGKADVERRKAVERRVVQEKKPEHRIAGRNLGPGTSDREEQKHSETEVRLQQESSRVAIELLDRARKPRHDAHQQVDGLIDPDPVRIELDGQVEGTERQMTHGEEDQAL
jgi:hypothetical protein